MKTIQTYKSWIWAFLLVGLFSLPVLTMRGAFDVFMYAVGDKSIIGETQDETAASQNAFEVLSFELGAENNVNIGSISAGGGAGKATFKEATFTKKVDTSTPGFFSKLTVGDHIDEMVLYMRRQGGGANQTDPDGFLKFRLKMVFVQDVKWSGEVGDDIVTETVVIQFGAIEVAYRKQDEKGKLSKAEIAQWSRIWNEASLKVE